MGVLNGEKTGEYCEISSRPLYVSEKTASFDDIGVKISLINGDVHAIFVVNENLLIFDNIRVEISFKNGTGVVV